MVYHLHKFVVVIFTTYFCCVWGRAVNISNTWVLPEEGFPVFYRYFRDRISWYEADAVCQFHHGNLVTVGNTSQFDAVRAYLKELDIINNVWIGLTRPSDKTTYEWSGNKPLLGDGFWGEVSAVPGIAVCAAADPAADFRWHTMTCGGPEVASFICELPVPPWALGVNGCMLTSLPSLTVIYLPEQTALELTSDCGLDGTKRIACKGNADQQEMMRQLSCGITHEDFDEKVAVSKAPAQPATADIFSNRIINSNELNINDRGGGGGGGTIAIAMAMATATITETTTTPTTTSVTGKATTKPWIWTSNTIDTSSEFGSPTRRHRRETEDAVGGGIRLRSTTDITAHKRHMDTTETSSTIRPSYMSSTVQLSKVDHKLRTTTSNPLPETNRQRPTRKSRDPFTTTITVGGSGSASTTETSTAEIPNHTTITGDEYPSINQGQLFSIIENGTIFDIIEVNDTSETDSGASTFKSSLTTSTPSPITTVTTTTTTSEFSKKPAKHSPNDLLVHGQLEKTFMKTIELETTSDTTSTMVKLNRTNRKELPLVDSTEHTDIKPSTTTTTTTNKGSTNIHHHHHHHSHHQQQQHKIVEITITDIERKTDATKFYVTTKNVQNVLYDEKNNTVPVIMNNKNLEISDANNVTMKKIQEFMNTTQRRNATDESTQPKSIVVDDEYEEDVIERKDDGDDDDDDHDDDDDDKTTEEPVEPIPEAQPRPNRNRVLTRPQRRSFYPYFFSRVLG